ncbi:MAG: hypothetical protein GY842_22940 [bacterium]|nr:hypothetical protein [bacterium]
MLVILLALVSGGCVGYSSWWNTPSDSSGGELRVGDVAAAQPVATEDDTADSAQPAPAAGIIEAQVRNLTDHSAEVTIRFLLNNIVVHLARLRIEPRSTTSLVGPELAQLVEFTGVDHLGAPLSPQNFVFGTDLEDNEPAVYIISDGGEPEPEQPVDDVVDDTTVPEEEDPGDDEDEEEEEEEEEDDGGGTTPGGGGSTTTPTDCNHNGVDDAADLSAGTSVDCNLNQVPDECDIYAETSSDYNENGVPDECEDCNENGTMDSLDLELGQSADCNSNAVPDECDINAGTSVDANSDGTPDECRDCNENGVLDGQDISQGTSEDCNENLTPDECDVSGETSPDTNTNGVPDECEDCNDNGTLDDMDLAYGISQDCNGNAIPDECDLSAGTSPDCNSTGVPDECDVAAGSSSDTDSNGVPDECDPQVMYVIDPLGAALMTLQPENGVITLTAGPTPSVSSAEGLCFEQAPRGVEQRSMYSLVNASTSGVQLVTIDPATAAVQIRASLGDDVDGLAFSIYGILYGVLGAGSEDPGAIVIIGRVDGSLTPVDLAGANGAQFTLAAHPYANGLYRVACTDYCRLDYIDLDYGMVITVDSQMDKLYQAVTFDVAQNRLIGAAKHAGPTAGETLIVAIDLTTGGEQILSVVVPHTRISGMAFPPAFGQN